MKDMRRHLRARVPDERLMECDASQPPLRGQISVFGLGGMYIRTPQAYPIGTKLHVNIRSAGGPIEVDCVVRLAEPSGLGVEFSGISPAQAAELKKIFSRLQPRP